MNMHMRPLLEPVQEFPASLRRILDDREISASELARMMAYKSRNSIFRILDGAGGQSARQAFYDRLIGEDPLGLSNEERAQLEQALEVSRVGLNAFMGNRALREMLSGRDEQEAQPAVYIDTPPESDDPGFLRAIEEMGKSRQVHIVIMGCNQREVFEAIREQIYKADVTCEVKVTHLIYTGAEEIVNNISAVQPLLYCDRYTAYCLEPGLLSREREAFYRQNSIYIMLTDQQGEAWVQPLVLIDKGVFISLNRVKITGGDRFQSYFEKDLKKLPLLKAQLPGSGELAGYLNYIQSCRKLEANRTSYTIKPDITLSCIHPDVLLSCVKEEFWQLAGERAEEIKREFFRIHLARWENIFDRRRISHMIFSQEAMRRFARTGRQSDHFFAVRTYTPDERVQILETIKEKMIESAGLRLYFFNGDFEPPATEIGLYEGAGTLMTKPDTHYDLAGDHAEAFITQEEFCERYKEFYVEDLLERYVISREETLRLMDELIAIAKSAS